MLSRQRAFKLNMKRLMTKILNLPGVIVEKSLETEETIILSVRVKNETAVCRRCGQTSRRLHQNKMHLVRDLPITNARSNSKSKSPTV